MIIPSWIYVIFSGLLLACTIFGYLLGYTSGKIDGRAQALLDKIENKPRHPRKGPSM